MLGFQSLFGLVKFSVQNDSLRFKERHNAFASTFAANAGLFKAAEGDREISSQGIVADRARPDSPGSSIGAVDVVGEDRGVQAENAVIGDLDCVGFAVCWDDADHRT